MAQKTKTNKTKTKRITSVTIRENKAKDHSPSWDNHEELSSLEFSRKYHDAMQYYNVEYSGKDLKPSVIKWMSQSNFDSDTINAFKKTKDWRCSVVVGAIASCLLKGMPAIREDFNQGRNSEEWLKNKINEIISQGKNDCSDDDDTTAPVPTIQERVRETAIRMAEDIDEAIEQFYTNPDKFDQKSLNILNNLKAKQVKPAHARIIKEFYNSEFLEISELVSNSNSEVKEAYSHWNKKQIKTFAEFHKEIQDACNMLMQEAKVNRKPRAKKPVAKDKIVAKLNYKKTDETLKLVSVNPVDIIGAKELWCFDTKTRKLFRYIADDMEGPLTVKGTSIIGFNTTKSIGKTLRKPAEQLAELKKSGKVALRSFLDNINAVEVKANGRINSNQILFRVI